MTVQTIIPKLKERHYKNFRKTNLNSENIHYVSYIMMYTETVLRMFGVWPTENNKKGTIRKIYDIFIIFFTYILVVFVTTTAVLNVLIEKNGRIRLKKLPLLLVLLDNIIKYSSLLIRRDQIRCCLTYLEEDWKNFPDARNLMIERAKLARRITIFIVIIMYFAGVCNRVISPIHLRKLAIALNITIRPLPYPTYLFSVNTEATPIYEILYFLQFLCTFIILSTSAAAYGTATALILHGCVQMRLLMRLMSSFIEKHWKNEANITKKLANLVEYQVRVYRYIKLVNTSLGFLLFTGIIAGVVTLCMGGYSMVTGYEDNDSVVLFLSCLFLAAVLIDIFVLCYVGDLLIFESDKLFFTSCELDWYRLPMKTARAVVLVILKSTAPLKITPGSIFDLSLKMYSDIIKTAVACMNMFRAVT